MPIIETDQAALRGNPSFVWRAGQERRLAMVQQYAALDSKRVLDVDRKTDRIDNTGKLDQASIAHQLDGPPVVPYDSWIDFVAPERLQRR